MKISIRDFNSNVSLFLRRAHAGETILVTRRDQPFVEITAPGSARGTGKPLADLKSRLEAIPGVSWSGLSHHDLLPPVAVKFKGKGTTASEIVLEGRR